MFTICFYTEYRTQSPAARGLNSPAVGPGGATKREWQDGRRQVVRIIISIIHMGSFARYHPRQKLRVRPRRLLAALRDFACRLVASLLAPLRDRTADIRWRSPA